jgi:hypothetical protein
MTPPHPSTLVLDTRTHRYTMPERALDAPPITLDSKKIELVKSALTAMSSPRLIVSPVPLT